MPELPEVETVCRTMRRVLQGQKIVAAEFPADSIVMKGFTPEAFIQAAVDRTVTAIGRRGKYWWIEFEDFPFLYGHLGMAGWIREHGAHTIRLREHGNAPLDDETGRPRFLKMRLQAASGKEIVLTDGRRLARLWLGKSPTEDPRICSLGPDVYDEPYSAKDLHQILLKRKAPMKAVLLDQKVFPGVGNWIADEVLYQAAISPKRLGAEMSLSQTKALLEKLASILRLAVAVGADAEQYPEDWLFHVRWGGAKGRESIGGVELVREPVGGRTTAWAPSIQK